MARKRKAPAVETHPMVYDGYYGDFVPVELASFDVSMTPEAVVELPWPEAEPSTPRGRPSRPRRCDACRERRPNLQHSNDSMLAVCGRCAQDIVVKRLDAATVIAALVGRAPVAERRDLEHRLSVRRAVRAARQERKARRE